MQNELISHHLGYPCNLFMQHHSGCLEERKEERRERKKERKEKTVDTKPKMRSIAVICPTQSLASHLPQLLLAAVVEKVLAHVHQLTEEDVAHLKEAAASGLHQGVQDRVDIRLDADL